MPLPKPAPLTTPDAQPALRVLPTPEPAPAPAAKPKGGLSLGKLGAARPAKSGSKEHPIAPATEESQKMAEQYAILKPQFDALEGQLDSLRGQIIEHVFPAWLDHSRTNPDTTSMLLMGPVPATAEEEQRKIMVSLQNRYAGTVPFEDGAAAIIEAIRREGEEQEQTEARFAEFFEQGIAVSIAISKVAEEKRQPLIDDLLPILEKHGLLGEDTGVTCKQILAAKKSLAVLRHTAFTREENLRIQKILPAVGVVKVTGVKK